jgi:hypothetical protein
MNEVRHLTVNQQNKKTTIKVKSTILVSEYHKILS